MSRLDRASTEVPPPLPGWLAATTVFVSGLLVGLVPLLRGRTFFHWDNAQQHLPQTAFLHDALRNWSFPEWWPQVGMGVPTVSE